MKFELSTPDFFDNSTYLINGLAYWVNSMGYTK
jgi:hypothetical protein